MQFTEFKSFFSKEEVRLKYDTLTKCIPLQIHRIQLVFPRRGILSVRINHILPRRSSSFKRNLFTDLIHILLHKTTDHCIHCVIIYHKNPPNAVPYSKRENMFDQIDHILLYSTQLTIHLPVDYLK